MRTFASALAGLIAVLALLAPASAGAASPLLGCETSNLYVVAHQDDSLLFQSPALLQNVASGDCVRSVFLTAGDAGLDASYWSTREEGVEAAYAQMAGVANSWTRTVETVNGHAITAETLNGEPRISVLFMRLPDGNPDGEGTAMFGHQSLRQLWANGNPNGSLEPAISSITAVDGSASYGYQDLIDTLSALIGSFGPNVIATQNFDSPFGGADHADHVATALFTQAAQHSYAAPHQLLGYEDYESSQRPANLSGSLLTAKRGYFYTYGEHDSHACAGDGSCEQSEYWSWLAREYVAATETTGVVANAGPNQSVASGAAVSLDGSASSAEAGKSLTYQWTQTAGPTVALQTPTTAKPSFTAPTGPATLGFSLVVSDGQRSSTPATVSVTVAAPSTPASTNVARLATATASSQVSSQPAAKAIDGVIGGYPKNDAAEWSSNGGKAGTTLTLKWTKSYTLDRVVLYDRPNTDDQITAGKLTFSDGQSVTFAALPNAGTPGLTVSFPAHATTSLVMSVTSVSTATRNVGLAEIEAFGVATESGPSEPPATAPAITSASSAGFTSGTAASFTVTASGKPAAALSESGALPSGITFKDNGNGTATLAGTAAAVGAPGSSRSYPLTLSATNSAGTANQQFTLTVLNGEVAAAPVANAGPNQSVASGAAVSLDGSASSAEAGKSLTYQWTQTAGPTVALQTPTTAKPSFTAPTGPATLGFSLVVSDGQRSSTPATVSVTVAAPSTPASTNVARLATATASSQVSSQPAAKAIDGVIGGYPKNDAAEWSSNGGKAGTTLTLKWTKSYTLDRVVLYDRPNTDDQITAGKLTFSDGQSVTFAALPNAGTPGLTVSFPAHATTSLVMSVTSVSTATRNVGLAEIEAFGVATESGPSEPPATAPAITSASSAGFTSGTAASFTVTASGKPAAALSESGALPSGITFKDNGNGTATLAGTAAAVGAPGSSRSYPLTLSATNSAGTANQQFTLTVLNGEVAAAPVANAGPNQSVASGAAVSLDGSASSAEAGKSLTYQWTQTAGPTVALQTPTTAKPSFTAPTGPATLGFSLVVSDGQRSSTPATVSVTVAAPSTPASTNVARLATATASSQVSSQPAAKAIDGVIGGYPKNDAAEWSSNGGKAGTTLTLKWTKSYTLDRVVLYDRPNTDDQITAGKLTFSDGQSVTFAALPNAGTPGLTVSFPAHATTSLVMSVTSVSTATRNVGLAEIEAFGSATN